MVNWRGARRLLNRAFPLRYQLDTELWLNFDTLDPLVALPLAIGEKKGASDIQIAPRKPPVSVPFTHDYK